jgi:ATP-dependent Clp protease adaptor protein ClpS
MWQVVLLDDDDHTYDYVIEMLMDIFGHPLDLAYRMACEVDAKGRVIVDVDAKEPATAKCERIRSYGPDERMERSRGSMSAIVEPVE